MCTAIAYESCFGRTLDLEYHYQESVTITPRRFPFPFRKLPALPSHYAIIGVATVAENYPLYYDAGNEKGLYIAGLNFPKNAVYRDDGNLAAFELIPWILGQCSSVYEAREALEGCKVSSLAFSEDFPSTPLHWLIADERECMTVEPVQEGLLLYENALGVLCNNPPFPEQLKRWESCSRLTPEEPEGTWESRGMGAMGLPGDWSSSSRFIRAVFTKKNSMSQDTEKLTQFFHIMDTVAQVEGCVRLQNGKQVKTIYTSCFDAKTKHFYYTTYENRQLSCVRLTEADGESLQSYPLLTRQSIRSVN